MQEKVDKILCKEKCGKSATSGGDRRNIFTGQNVMEMINIHSVSV